MADFPVIGIDSEELELEIFRAYERYNDTLMKVRIYADVDESIREIGFFGRVSKTVAEITTENLVSFYRNVIYLKKEQGELSCLLKIYKKYFPDSEISFLDEKKLEGIISSNGDSVEIKQKELLGRLKANFGQGLERYYSEI
ncbi:hypothetical protein HOE04_03940 [archaeon]|jgi:hypothetical protein|nr:hypothetical protein [archaeon]